MNHYPAMETARYFFVLVDDDPRIHEFLVNTLAEDGLLGRHVSFEDPISFIEFLKGCEDEPDAVLLDIHFKNAGLSGVDIIPFIREDYPYLPIILLTGMDNEAVQEAEEYDCTYFIPKPVTPENLTKMIRFYMGKSQKSSRVIQELTDELAEYREYQKLLEDEIEALQTGKDSRKDKKGQRDKREKLFQRTNEILAGILHNSEIMPSFIKDLESIYNGHYELFKKVIEILVRFDIMDISSPGLNIHKVKGTENVYSARLSKKVRLFFYIGASAQKRKLLRLDTVHDTKGMDKWIKENYKSYA